MIEHDALISEYSHERHRPRESEALLMLRKVASIVKPIMRQRMWRVGTLAEFYPADRQPNGLILHGLNENRGQRIFLRLRHPYDDRQFLALETVVDTMLHELCHNVFGPHDQKFHDLWNQLRDEHQALVSKGYTGEGFLSTGQKLGGSRIPRDEARRRARLAASEQQRRLQQATGGHRLGGRGIARGEDPRAVVAEAAQHRNTIMKGCASESKDRGWKEKIAKEASKNGFKTKAEEDDANERAIMQAYIELIQEEEREKYGQNYVPPSQDNPIGRRNGNGSDPTTSRMSPPPIPLSSKPTFPQSQSGSRALSENNGDSNLSHATVSSNRNYNDAWDCPICTLINPPTYLCCDGCGTERPAPFRESSPSAASRTISSKGKTTSNPKPNSALQRKSSYQNMTRFAQAATEAAQKRPIGWRCHSCGSFMESQWWTCSSCGTMKLSS